MRALHLIGLRAPGGKKLRYPSEDDEPLRRRQLLLDERLIRWAQWLSQEPFRDVAANRLRAAFERGASPPIGAAEVLGWLDEKSQRSMTDNELLNRINKAMTWANEGALDRAKDELEALAPELEIASVPNEVRALFGVVASMVDIFDAVRKVGVDPPQSSS